jgi:uncharacterized protein YuzE
MRKFHFDYDAANDDLFVYRKDSKSEGGVEIGRLLLDFNNKDGLVGIEFMDATSLLASSTGLSKKAVSSILRNLRECKVELDVWRNSIVTIRVMFLSEGNEQVLWNFSLPQISEENSPLAKLAVS